MEVNELKRNGKEQIKTEYNKYFVETKRNGTNSKELERNRTERNIYDIL